MKKMIIFFMFMFTQASFSQWIPCTNGLAVNEIINVLTVSGTFIFAGTPSGVYRSADDGDYWATINTGLPATKIIKCLAIKGTTIYAGAFAERIYKTDINGPGWVNANTGLSHSYIYCLYINGSTIYAGTNGAGVYSSANEGLSHAHALAQALALIWPASHALRNAFSASA